MAKASDNVCMNFIDGVWVEGTGERYTASNPADGSVVWHSHSASVYDVDRAFAAAENAFLAWAVTPLAHRLAVVEKYQALLVQHREQLANDIMVDTGKPAWEVKTEVAAMIAKVNLSVQSYHDRTGQYSRGETDKCLLTHRPHGVCAVFGPYNFPGHLPNGHIIPALIAGNTVIFKPSEHTPSVGARMVKLLADAGVPDGVINFLPGGMLSTAKAIVAHKKLRGFFFTGSSAVGTQIHQQLGGRTDVILALEMGGNNPLVVLADAVNGAEKCQAAVYHTLQSAFITAGQRCTCARRLIVPKGKAGDRFIDMLISAAKQLTIDLPDAEKQPFYSLLINNHAADRLLNAQEKLLALGGKSLLMMQRLLQKAPMLSPAIIDVSQVAGVPDEEYFGPLLKVYRVDDVDAAIDIANATQYGLSAGIFTEDNTHWQRFYQLIRAGIVNRNKPLTGASGAAPFGGTGRSGNHRPSAYYAADYCAYPVASITSETMALPEAQSPGIAIAQP